MEPDENLGVLSERRREQESLGSRQELRVWSLWVLASAIGGAAGGATFVIEFVGPLILFGGILGAAQALVLAVYLRHDRVRGAILWAVCSFSGWVLGWLALILARIALQELVPQLIAQHIVSERLTGYTSIGLVIGIVFGVSQSAVLLTILVPLLGGRSSRGLVALWVLVAALGGVPGAVASFIMSTMVLPSGSGVSSSNEIMVLAVQQAVAGALYGVVTGWVIARVVRRVMS